MARLSRWLRLVCIISAAVVLFSTAENAYLSENVVEKDLYAILGVNQQASLQDVKKAFRKLAQLYHPDKKRGDIDRHTSTFQEISEAYDILSNKALRAQYDSRRLFISHDEEYGHVHPEDILERSYRYYEPSEFVEVHIIEDYRQDMLHGDQRSFQASEADLDASIAGPILHMGQVMFPYDEILSTLDHTAFALLDHTCSLVVYRGDARLFATGVTRHNGRLIHGTVPSTVQEVYRSPAFPFLSGRCVGVLDYSGVFHICMRDQYGDGGDSVWSTSNNSFGSSQVQSEPDGQYMMQLTTEGELIIHQTSDHGGGRVNHCVWSSLSCHPILYVLRDTSRALLHSIRCMISLDALKGLMRAVRKIAAALIRRVRRWWSEQNTCM